MSVSIPSLMTPIPFPFLSVLGGYLMILGIIGWAASRKTRSLKDFFIMGGKAGSMVSGLAYFASQYSMSTFMGVPAITYTNGFAGLSISVPGLAFSMLIPALLIGRKLLKLGKKLNFLTMSDYLAHRFDSKGVRGFHAASVIIFLVCMMGAQTLGAGIIFQTFTGFPSWIGVVGMGVIVTLYCMGGGMKSAMLTDVLQGGLMVVTAVVTFYVSLKAGGGLAVITSTLHTNMGDAYLTHPGAQGGFAWPIYISMIVMWSFFTMGQPILLTKFFAMKNYHVLFKAVILGTLGMLLSATLIEWAGVNALVSLPGLKGKDTDFIVPLLLNNTLDPYIASLLMAGVFSAGMSTIDALLVVATGGVVYDIYRNLMNPSASDDQILFLSRAMTVLLGIVAIFIGIFQPASIFDLVRFAFGGLGIWTTPVLLGLYWKKATKTGVFVSIMLGDALYIYFKTIGISLTFGFDPLIISWIVSSVVMIFVSYYTKPPGLKIIQNYFDLEK